jgi:hypothetical protein
MFEPKTKTVEIEGQRVTLRQLTIGESIEMAEDADLAEVVALAWVEPDGVTADDVRKWPMTIVTKLYDVCAELNGLAEGN